MGNNKLGLFVVLLGIFVISTTTYLSRHIYITDFLRGIFNGVGIGLEIIGIIIMQQKKLHFKFM
ncbi:hypothetical protein TheetDRAFT_1607 [Thermoanaerobacter ethanolicus JW 200]|uniref:hypothetical protein n=1 Tax=Thermoanaerobacter sp. RKWS2 TaxID=2983842 RepID=UPI000202EA32|nr:hypothetical protein [Thermoanaerobacter sp. RKWS2]EGD51647.1 hypothetical protein TheetDRAFT_1607 [Thermoanaerobacter ethanolicus JW 200]UZQ82679.1 hypothetical protein OEI98_002594 [Thermoanaerobacter sp. RKWS2]